MGPECQQLKSRTSGGHFSANEQPASQSHGKEESQSGDSQLSEADSWRRLYSQTLKTEIQIRALSVMSNKVTLGLFFLFCEMTL